MNLNGAIKILHIVPSLDPKSGGISQALKTIVKGLSQIGIYSEAATADDPDAYFISDENFKIYALGPFKTTWKYAPEMLKWLNAHISQYDAVIVHGLWQYHTYASYRAYSNLTEKKPKIYVMPHGMLDPYFQKAKGRRLKAIRNWVFWKLSEQKLVNVADGLLFTCWAEQRLAGQTFSPYHPKSESVVGLGVEDPPEFTTEMIMAFKQKTGFAGKDFLLFMGRIDIKKGVDLLVAAYNRLCMEKTDLPGLVIAGPGLDSEYGKSLMTLAESNENIVFSGMLTGHSKWGAFYSSNAFILPSHQENFGIAVVEAMACGKAVLISHQVNIWEEIIAGQGGIAESDDEEGIYRMLLSWLSRPKLDQLAMGGSARQTFLENFTVKNAATRLFDVIK